MTEARNPIYRNIIGDTNETIEAIQRFLEKNSPKQNNAIVFEEEDPAGSINRVIKSVLNEDIVNEIEKIIKDL